MGSALTTLRSMALGDVPEVSALEAAHQPQPWSEAVVRDELSAANRSYFVVVDEGIVGFGGIMVLGDEAHVTNLLIDEAHRGRGLATRLLRAMIEAARGGDARHLTLEVRRGNHAARSLYHKFGLAPVGIRRRYYGDDDALIMWAHDIDDPDYMESLP